ncbi:MAG: hypothetical protein MGG37_02805 [Trichodesmium sp. MAG_R01]|nr:hypothetical protein [Trichodesmium sp. MAG_R01]
MISIIFNLAFDLRGKIADFRENCSLARCNVSDYGVWMKKNIDEADNIQYPLMLNIAKKNNYIYP